MATILVIEDDKDLLFLYHMALTQRGHTVIEAHTSAEAMKFFQDPAMLPDLIFVDMGMPDAPGTHIINYVRGEPRYDTTKIVVVTANDQYKIRIAEKDISQFLVKPVTIATLVQVAEELTAK